MPATAQLNSHPSCWLGHTFYCRNLSDLNFDDARMLRREKFRVNAEWHLPIETPTAKRGIAKYFLQNGEYTGFDLNEN
jgi:hypothetical protein